MMGQDRGDEDSVGAAGTTLPGCMLPYCEHSYSVIYKYLKYS